MKTNEVMRAAGAVAGPLLICALLAASLGVGRFGLGAGAGQPGASSSTRRTACRRPIATRWMSATACGSTRRAGKASPSCRWSRAGAGRPATRRRPAFGTRPDRKRDAAVVAAGDRRSGEAAACLRGLPPAPERERPAGRIRRRHIGSDERAPADLEQTAGDRPYPLSGRQARNGRARHFRHTSRTADPPAAGG